MPTCRMPDCPRPVLVKSLALCQTHYHRMRDKGDPAAPVKEYERGPDRWRKLYTVEPAGCWRWTGSLDKYGYGQYDLRVDGKRKNWRAHRYVYEQLVRPLRAGETIDHLCRNHACVNPEHLDPVPHAENVRRGLGGQHNAHKTHCPQGHPYDEENTVRNGTGRGCRACLRKQHREATRRMRGTAPDAVHNGAKTHCKHGHEFTPENTILTARGHRKCRECQRRAVREAMRRRRAMT